MIYLDKYLEILSELKKYDATLVAVSKTKPVEDIRMLVENGQKIFGENYVKELSVKQKQIQEVSWHFIGHLQSNKAKTVVEIADLIHGVDSMKLLKEINKEAAAMNKTQNCLLQIHIATEETKFGFTIEEAEKILESNFLAGLNNVRVKGFMAMASLTDNKEQVRNEFRSVNTIFIKYKNETINILSTGMTGDYKIALEEGSTMIRIGSAIFGSR
jgi:pyridoxal phosphate enzyme (YggS family)